MEEIAPRIVVDKEVRSGKPVIKGTRVPVDLILGKLAGGMSIEEVAKEYELQREDILAVLATGTAIRELPRLQKVHGPGRWRKLKGVALVQLQDGTTSRAEVPWYEAHGIGRKELKIKRFLT
jgi:uncharacterized protein (DUF433 family)